MLPSLCPMTCSPRQTEGAGKASFDPLASPNAQHGFDPDDPSRGSAVGASLRSLFPGRSPSIPMAVVGGRPRRNGGGTPERRERAVAGPQRLRSGRSGRGLKLEAAAGINGSSSRGSTDQNQTRDVPSLAPLWAAIQEVLFADTRDATPMRSCRTYKLAK